MSSDLNFREEIRVAQYWRKQMGDLEYVKRDPDDLFRWYEALENRGPVEIRAYLVERSGRHPMVEVTGIVAKAPHPTRDIVDIWLASHEEARTMPYWAGAAAFLILCLLIGPNVSGCQNMHQIRLFPNGAPPQATLAPGQVGATGPTSQATAPAQFPLPANTASPAAGSQNQRSSQHP
jgi:hypothetical protein